MPGRGQIATKKFDHWDASTGTGYEFNTTPWGYISAKRLKEKIMSKLDQGNGDFALLNDHDLLRRKFPPTASPQHNLGYERTFTYARDCPSPSISDGSG